MPQDLSSATPKETACRSQGARKGVLQEQEGSQSVQQAAAQVHHRHPAAAPPAPVTALLRGQSSAASKECVEHAQSIAISGDQRASDSTHKLGRSARGFAALRFTNMDLQEMVDLEGVLHLLISARGRVGCASSAPTGQFSHQCVAAHLRALWSIDESR